MEGRLNQRNGREAVCKEITAANFPEMKNI